MMLNRNHEWAEIFTEKNKHTIDSFRFFSQVSLNNLVIPDTHCSQDDTSGYKCPKTMLCEFMRTFTLLLFFSQVSLNNLAIPDTHCSQDGVSGYKCPKTMLCMALQLSQASKGYSGFDEFGKYPIRVCSVPKRTDYFEDFYWHQRKFLKIFEREVLVRH